MNKIFLILLIVLLNYNYLYSQEYLYYELPYYYTNLPFEFWNAYEIKKLKLKKETVKQKLKSRNGTYSFYHYTYNYDTNGISLKLTGLDTSNYYTAYHMDDDFLVDSTRYFVKDGLLEKFIQYFRTGYNYKYDFYYDLNNRCIKSNQYENDSIIDTDLYQYDSIGRLIRKGNDSSYIEFVFRDGKIREIISYLGRKKSSENKYIYDKNNNSRTELEVNKKGNKVIEKQFYDENGFVNVNISYRKTSNNGRVFSFIIKSLYERNSKGDILSKNIYEITGNIISRHNKYIYFYYKNGLIKKTVLYSQWNQPEGYTKYLYEFY